MSQIEPPAALSRAEKRAFRRVASTMVGHGLDPADRVELLADFVRSDARLEALRKEEAASTGPEMIRASRAVNVASAERRRLHAALFVGGRKLADDPRLARVKEAEIAGPTEADEAWRDHLNPRERGLSRPADPWTSAERAAFEGRGEEIEAQHGPATWNALLYKTHDEQLEAHRILAAYGRRSSQPLRGASPSGGR